MSVSGLGGEFALIGMAESAVGIVPDKSPRELCVQVTLDAIKDAGLTLAEVDGLITCNAFAEPIMYHAEAVAEYIGWQPRHCVTVNTGGGTTFMALNMAAAARAISFSIAFLRKSCCCCCCCCCRFCWYSLLHSF